MSNNPGTPSSPSHRESPSKPTTPTNYVKTRRQRKAEDAELAAMVAASRHEGEEEEAEGSSSENNNNNKKPTGADIQYLFSAKEINRTKKDMEFFDEIIEDQDDMKMVVAELKDFFVECYDDRKKNGIDATTITKIKWDQFLKTEIHVQELQLLQRHFELILDEKYNTDDISIRTSLAALGLLIPCDASNPNEVKEGVDIFYEMVFGNPRFVIKSRFSRNDVQVEVAHSINSNLFTALTAKLDESKNNDIEMFHQKIIYGVMEVSCEEADNQSLPLIPTAHVPSSTAPTSVMKKVGKTVSKEGYETLKKFVNLPEEYLEGLDSDAFGDDVKTNNSLVSFHIAALSLRFNHFCTVHKMLELFFYLLGKETVSYSYLEFLYFGRNIDMKIIYQATTQIYWYCRLLLSQLISIQVFPLNGNHRTLFAASYLSGFEYDVEKNVFVQLDYNQRVPLKTLLTKTFEAHVKLGAKLEKDDLVSTAVSLQNATMSARALTKEDNLIRIFNCLYLDELQTKTLKSFKVPGFTEEEPFNIPKKWDIELTSGYQDVPKMLSMQFRNSIELVFLSWFMGERDQLLYSCFGKEFKSIKTPRDVDTKGQDKVLTPSQLQHNFVNNVLPFRFPAMAETKETDGNISTTTRVSKSHLLAGKLWKISSDFSSLNPNSGANQEVFQVSPHIMLYFSEWCLYSCQTKEDVKRMSSTLRRDSSMSKYANKLEPSVCCSWSTTNDLIPPDATSVFSVTDASFFRKLLQSINSLATVSVWKLYSGLNVAGTSPTNATVTTFGTKDHIKFTTNTMKNCDLIIEKHVVLAKIGIVQAFNKFVELHGLFPTVHRGFAIWEKFLLRRSSKENNVFMNKSEEGEVIRAPTLSMTSFWPSVFAIVEYLFAIGYIRNELAWIFMTKTKGNAAKIIDGTAVPLLEQDVKTMMKLTDDTRVPFYTLGNELLISKNETERTFDHNKIYELGLFPKRFTLVGVLEQIVFGRVLTDLGYKKMFELLWETPPMIPTDHFIPANQNSLTPRIPLFLHNAIGYLLPKAKVADVTKMSDKEEDDNTNKSAKEDNDEITQTFDFDAVIQKFMSDERPKVQTNSKFQVFVDIFGGLKQHYLNTKKVDLEAQSMWSYLSNQDPSYSLGKQVCDVDSGMFFIVHREFRTPIKATTKLIKPFFSVDLPQVRVTRRTTTATNGHIIKWVMKKLDHKDNGDDEVIREWQQFTYPETHACLNVLIQYFLRFDKMYKPFLSTDDVVQTAAKRPIIDIDQLYYLASFANMPEFEEDAAFKYYNNVTDALDDFAERALATFNDNKTILDEKQAGGSGRNRDATNTTSGESKAEEETDKAKEVTIEEMFANATSKHDMTKLMNLLKAGFQKVKKIPPKMNLICNDAKVLSEVEPFLGRTKAMYNFRLSFNFIRWYLYCYISRDSQYGDTLCKLSVINEEQLLNICAYMVTPKASHNLLPVVNKTHLYNKFKSDFIECTKGKFLEQMPQEDATVKEERKQKMESRTVKKAIETINATTIKGTNITLLRNLFNEGEEESSVDEENLNNTTAATGGTIGKKKRKSSAAKKNEGEEVAKKHKEKHPSEIPTFHDVSEDVLKSMNFVRQVCGWNVFIPSDQGFNNKMIVLRKSDCDGDRIDTSALMEILVGGSKAASTHSNEQPNMTTEGERVPTATAGTQVDTQKQVDKPSASTAGTQVDPQKQVDKPTDTTPTEATAMTTKTKFEVHQQCICNKQNKDGELVEILSVDVDKDDGIAFYWVKIVGKDDEIATTDDYLYQLKDGVSVEKRNVGTTKSGDSVMFNVGDEAVLRGVTVKIVKVHFDDPSGPYFTVMKPNGDECQTVSSCLAVIGTEDDRK